MELTKIRILRKPLFYGTYALIMRVYFCYFNIFCNLDNSLKKATFRFSSELQRVFNPVIPFPALNGKNNLALSELVKAKVGQLLMS